MLLAEVNGTQVSERKVEHKLVEPLAARETRELKVDRNIKRGWI